MPSSSRPASGPRRLAVLLLPLLAAGCALPLVSESELEGESAAEFQKMRTQVPVSTDARTRAYINCVANAIVRQLPPPYVDEDWEIEVFDSEEINAFALPGGRIGVNTGILQVAENQDQLAAVIGHEVAHVTEQHALDRVNREMTTQGAVMVGAAAIGAPGAGDLLAMGAQLGVSLPFSRADETQADTEGLLFMAKAGFNPQQSIQLWKNMEQKNKLGPPEFLSTHPAGDTRIQDLVRQLPAALKEYNAAVAAGRKPNCRQ